MANRLVELAVVFAPLSLVTIGGGQTVVAEIQRQAVEVHGWLSAPEFMDLFAISRMAPGPGSLLVTLIGWTVGGFWGAVVATIAIFGPTFLLIYSVAHIWARYRGARWQLALERGLRPIAAGMILAASYVLLQSLSGGWLARGVAFTSTAVLIATRVQPLALLAAGSLAFVCLRHLGI